MSLKLGQVTVSRLTLKNGFVFMTGLTAPVNGETGANLAAPSSLYAHCAEDGGGLYINQGTRAVPVWKKLRVED